MKGSVGIKVLIAILVIVIIVAGVLVGIKVIKDKKGNEVNSNVNEQNEPIIVEKKLLFKKKLMEVTQQC